MVNSYFGRISCEQKVEIGNGGLQSLTFMPHLHFLTWVLYMLYLWTFQTICTRRAGHPAASLVGTFIIVHAAFIAFGLAAVCCMPPNIFLFKTNHVLIYLFSAALVLANLPYLIFFLRTRASIAVPKTAGFEG